MELLHEASTSYRKHLKAQNSKGDICTGEINTCEKGQHMSSNSLLIQLFDCCACFVLQLIKPQERVGGGAPGWLSP